MRIHPEQCSHSRITPSADLERFQACEQPSLSFIEQTEEQDDGGFHLVRQHVPRHPPDGNLRNLASGVDLPLALRLIQSEVDKGPTKPVSLDQVPMDQVQQALTRLDVQSVVQLACRISRRRLFHKAPAGVQQCSVSGEPDATTRPKTTRIKLTAGSQGVILPAMRVACQVRQLGQLAEHGHSGLGSKGLSQLVEGAHCALLQQAFQISGVELSGSHNGIGHHNEHMVNRTIIALHVPMIPHAGPATAAKRQNSGKITSLFPNHSAKRSPGSIDASETRHQLLRRYC